MSLFPDEDILTKEIQTCRGFIHKVPTDEDMAILKQSLSGSAYKIDVSANTQVTSHRIIPIICCLLVMILYTTVMNDNIEAQVSQNRLESIVNQANVLTSAQVRVGDSPVFVNGYGNAAYVANEDSDFVSVINTTSNTVIKNITVENGPRFMALPFGDGVYVANSGSDTVSVIDPLTNEVVAGVTFNINPFRGGQVICNGLDAPINRYFYVSSGTGCVARPNNGYEFASWIEALDGNSTGTINASTTSGSPWTPLLDIFGVKSADPAATLTVDRFGKFIAYFRALPPPVPAEFTVSLFTVVVTALVGSLFGRRWYCKLCK